MRKRRTLARLAVGTMALALVAAACGGDDDDDAGGATTTAAGATTTAAAATTTAAGGATTTAGGATTTEAEAETLQVDTANCPPEATTELAAGEDLKIGITLPQTGPLAAFGAIAQGLNTQFAKVNADGGVDGHQVVLISKDDAYDPNKTPPLVTELIEADKIMASIIQVGTPNVASVRGLHESSCTPQLFVGTGFPAWGDPANHPWTVGGILAYNTEAAMWGEFIDAKKPGAKVAQLVFNNDFGKSYQTAFETVAEEKGFEIVETKLHEGTAANIDNEVAAILAANPDVVLGETSGAFCPKLMAGLAAGGYKGITIVSATCASVASFFKPVDPAGNGVYVLGQQKDPSDPRFVDDAAMKEYKAAVTEFGAGADANNGSVATGYNSGALLIDVLTRAAEMEGGLTRANIMNAAWAVDFKIPLIVGGTAKLDGIKDAYISEFAEMLQYDASKGSQVPTGDTYDVEGKTGVYQAG
jgi:ABC-type branched-subunit amino acid transport system substrate-binding protein